MISSPISGAIIGYFTNWLAIKMLFRPYKEKRFLGLKMPFTPGLIPKGRYMLAEKLGKTLSENILTGDVLNKAIQSEEIRTKIEALVSSAYLKLSDDNITVESAIAYFFPDTGRLFEFAESALTKKAGEYIENPELLDSISSMLSGKLIEYLKSEKGDVNPEKLYEIVGRFAEEKLSELFDSGELKTRLQDFFAKLLEKLSDNDTPLEKFISHETLQSLYGYTERIMPKISELIGNLAITSPEIDSSLKKLVVKIADDNFGRFVGFFVNYEKTYENIKSNLAEYLTKPENRLEIIGKVNAFINSKLNITVGELYSKIPESFAGELPAKIGELFGKLKHDELIQGGRDLIGKAVAGKDSVNLYRLISNITPDLDIKLKQFIRSKLEELIIENKTAVLEQLSAKAVKLVRGFNLSEFARSQSESRKQNIVRFLNETSAGLIAQGGEYVISNLDLGKIIEDKVNEFEMDEAENLIISVVNKELRAITLLGGVLGFVIGLMPIFLDMFQ